MKESAWYPNLSPGLRRTGRACACVLHEGQLLMTPTRSGRWTFPGGGIEEGESPAQAAVREAWEECGARIRLFGEGFALVAPNGEEAVCFLARLVSLEPSPEGRPRLWINPHDQEWQGDHQVGGAMQELRRRGWV